MANNNRAARIGGEIRKILSSLITTRIKDPRVSKLSSVTDVEVTRDLSYATVYVSVFDPNHSIADHLDGLRKAKGFLRKELGKELRIFHIPDLIFAHDDSVAYGNRIEQVLRSLDLGAPGAESDDEAEMSERLSSDSDESLSGERTSTEHATAERGDVRDLSGGRDDSVESIEGDKRGERDERCGDAGEES